MVDWLAVRAELRRLRAERGFTRGRLQEKSGVEKTTIYRIENTKGLPNHTPDFESIEALVRGMGLTLSEFFARIEGLKPQPQSAQTDSSTEQSAEAQAHGDRALPVAPYISPLIGEGVVVSIAETLMHEFAATFTDAIKQLADSLIVRIDSRGQAPTARAHTPVRHASRRKAG